MNWMSLAVKNSIARATGVRYVALSERSSRMCRQSEITT